MNITSLTNIQRIVDHLQYIDEQYIANYIINDYINNFKQNLVQIVDDLPQNPEEGVLYLLSQGNSRYILKYRKNNKWIQLGSSVFDFTADSVLSSSSENAVQNKVIYNALSQKMDKSVLSNTINNLDSETPNSGAIYNALSNKLDEFDFIPLTCPQLKNIVDLPDEKYYLDILIWELVDGHYRGTSLGTYADTSETEISMGYTDTTEYPHYNGATPNYEGETVSRQGFRNLNFSTLQCLGRFSNYSYGLQNNKVYVPEYNAGWEMSYTELLSFRDLYDNTEVEADVYIASTTQNTETRTNSNGNIYPYPKNIYLSSLLFGSETNLLCGTNHVFIHFKQKVSLFNLAFSFKTSTYDKNDYINAWSNVFLDLRISEDGINYRSYKRFAPLWIEQFKYNNIPSNYTFEPDDFTFRVNF